MRRSGADRTDRSSIKLTSSMSIGRNQAPPRDIKRRTAHKHYKRIPPQTPPILTLVIELRTQTAVVAVHYLHESMQCIIGVLLPLSTPTERETINQTLPVPFRWCLWLATQSNTHTYSTNIWVRSVLLVCRISRHH